MENRVGRVNIAVGLSVMAGFMVYGFFLIYMRDFILTKRHGSRRVTWVNILSQN